MKKFILLASLAVTTALFTGCGGGGGGDGGVVAPPPPAVVYDVLYLDNVDGGGVEGVPYDCPSGPGVTGIDGSFQFLNGENCTFDLNGFFGSVVFDEFLYIDFADGAGYEGLGYDCFSGTGGFTDISGNFIYDADDECTFYL